MRFGRLVWTVFVLSGFASAFTAEEPVTMQGRIAVGGRLSLAQRPLDDPKLWVDGQMVVFPLPRIFLSGAFGRTQEKRLAVDAPDTTLSELRWEAGVGAVLMTSVASVYLPAIYRSVRQRHSWWGDASWHELGLGVGLLRMDAGMLGWRLEGLWMTANEHEDRSLGRGRSASGSWLELNAGFLIFVK